MDNMIPMRNAAGWDFALLFDPGHQQHGWIFYDNFGQWTTFRKATEDEMVKAAEIREMTQRFNAQAQAQAGKGE